jgi:hypothetical protein
MGNNFKKPVLSDLPKRKKIPVIRGELNDGDQMPLLDFAWFDNFQWWKEEEGDEKFQKMLVGLRDYCRRTWKAIQTEDRKRDHSIPVGAIIAQARNRLVQNNLEEIDIFWRFRFQGEQRLWGYKQGRIFLVIWWDPHHKICPSELKNT